MPARPNNDPQPLAGVPEFAQLSDGDVVNALGVLHATAARVWDADTSVLPERWGMGSATRSHGQAEVTALYVQMLFGGYLLSCEVFCGEPTRTHWFNELPGAQVVDLTRDQFPAASLFSAAVRRARRDLLSVEHTSERLGLFRQRMAEVSQ